jgi:hypothetical protein
MEIKSAVHRKVVLVVFLKGFKGVVAGVEQQATTHHTKQKISEFCDHIIGYEMVTGSVINFLENYLADSILFAAFGLSVVTHVIITPHNAFLTSMLRKRQDLSGVPSR